MLILLDEPKLGILMLRVFKFLECVVLLVRDLEGRPRFYAMICLSGLPFMILSRVDCFGCI